MCKHCDEFTKKFTNELPHDVIEKGGTSSLKDISIMLAVNTNDTRWLKDKVKDLDMKFWGVIFALLFALMGIWIKGM